MKKTLLANELPKNLSDCLLTTANLIATKQSTKLSSITSKTPAQNIPLLLAFSGGSDSTSLLLALTKMAPAFGFKVIACHINHNLRAQESENDAQFCQQLCQQLNVPCQIIKLPPADLAKAKHKHPSEELLRELRYKYLTNFARTNNIRFLLTAHTLDDQAETVLFRLFRGTALSGLQGIETCRKLENDLYLLRPLLKLTKLQCQNFITSEGIEFRHDSSNLNEIYNRNYIRHKILPAIAARFPDYSAHLDSLSIIAQAEDRYMDQIAQQLFEQFQSINLNTWSLETFKQQPLALQRRILTHALKYRGIEVSFKRIEEFIFLVMAELPNDLSFLYLNLNKDWRVKRTKDKFFWQTAIKAHSIGYLEPLLVNIPGVNSLPKINSQLIVETYQEKTHQFQDSSLQLSLDKQSIFADLSKISSPLILRSRLPGDKIRPLGMSQIVKLKKYLHTHKNNISHPFYPQLLLADQEEVLWLPGIGMSEKIKVVHSPTHKLRWQQY